MPVIDLPTARLEYDDLGKGRDVILFVHGHPFDRRMWAGAAEAAASAGWRAIIPDLRGYGASSVTPGRVTLEDFAADLISLLNVLGVAEAVVCGLSMGGQISMALCDLHPDRVRGLILAATFPRSETPEGRSARYVLADRLEAEGMTGYANDVLPRMLAADSIKRLPAVAEEVLTMMQRTPPVGAAAALRGRAERKDYTDTLRTFPSPALVVVGDQDAFTTRQDADDMAMALTESELLWLPGVGHMPNLEAGDRFNEALSGFLAALKNGDDQ
jgi:pimeloyl-ACP methyl ester carboxylesterase